MDESDESMHKSNQKSKQELEQELQWVKYRQDMLDIMEDKLHQMKQLAELANQGNLTEEELADINDKINTMAAEVDDIDADSRKIEYYIRL